MNAQPQRPTPDIQAKSNHAQMIPELPTFHLMLD
jgi:hypothetical protein